MKQREVAAILDVNVASVRNWEGNLREPHISEIPGIINYIGYCPYDLSLPLEKRAVVWRSYNGLTQKRMAKIIQVDPTTLARLERGRIRHPLNRARYTNRLVRHFSRLNPYE